MRRYLSPTHMPAVAALAFGAATIGAALVPNMPIVLALLVVGGFGWMIAMSTMNSTMQLLLPKCRRGQGRSVRHRRRPHPAPRSRHPTGSDPSLVAYLTSRG
ncbi:MFS transporter [Nocardia sp. NBC_01503]|uniref:MFS transporter n=1 Tax=Nocardia sp. NBC_01503 TaxID=2975997 RepID=UPI002E7C23F3|nr:MFS transporter [Nocardia sp. NBC_01503]WTL30457.1 MFS transporter [Nocardia sp. NBC_01503]